MNKILIILANILCLIGITILELVIGFLVFWLSGITDYKIAMINFSWAILRGFILNLILIAIWGIFKFRSEE